MTDEPTRTDINGSRAFARRTTPASLPTLAEAIPIVLEAAAYSFTPGQLAALHVLIRAAEGTQL